MILFLNKAIAVLPTSRLLLPTRRHCIHNTRNHLVGLESVTANCRKHFYTSPLTKPRIPRG
jgi:hypothetical protein